MFTCWLAGFAVCASASAITGEPSVTHYQGIAERNAFGLKPPPAPTQPELSPPSLPRLILTGITTILGQKQVLLKEEPPAVKGVAPPKAESFILAEGQREGPVEVLAIDEKAGSVEVRNSGTLMTLTFEKNGAKPANATTTPASLPTPGNPAAAPTRGGYPGRYLLPTRTPRLPATTPPNPAVGSVLPSPSSTAPGTSADAAAAGPAATTPIPTAPGEPSPDLSLEQQILQLELQRQAAQNGGGANSAAQPGVQPPTGYPGFNRVYPRPQLAPQ